MWASVTPSVTGPLIPHPPDGLPLPVIFLASSCSPPLLGSPNFTGWCEDQRGQLYENVDVLRCSQASGGGALLEECSASGDGPSALEVT